MEFTNSIRNIFLFGITLVFGSLILSSTARSESLLEQRLHEIRTIEKSINGTHDVIFKINGHSYETEQFINTKNCNLKIGINQPVLGNIFKDGYDLKKSKPIRKLIPFKGTYGIIFGAKSWMKGRTGLYFNDKNERTRVFNIFKNLRHLCRKRAIKDYFNRTAEALIPRKVEYQGYIAEGSTESDGRIITGQGQVASLEGRNSFIERYKTLINAKDLIYIQKLIFRGDIAGRFFADLLIKKHQSGVDVKIIVDALASGLMNFVQAKEDRQNTFIMLNNFMAAGIKVFGFSCDNSLASEFYGIDFGKILRRNHEKYWITDSKAIMGGVNIGQEYFSLTGKSQRSWRDHDVALTGPVVENIKQTFKRNWLTSTLRYKSWKADKKCLNPFNSLNEKKKYEKFLNEKTQKYLPYKKSEDREFAKIIRKNIQEYIKGNNPYGDNFHKDEVVYRPLERIRFISARPEEGENYTHQAIIDLINRAEKSIDLGMALLVPTEDSRAALKRAFKRGVKVRIYSKGKEIVGGGPPLMQILAGSYYHELIMAAEGTTGGIEIYEWTGKKSDGEIHFGSAHSKYMVVDGTAVLIGSHNLNHSSMKNTESVVVLEGIEIGEDFSSQFEFDLEFCRKIDKEEARLNHKPEKLRDRILLKLLKIIELFV